MINWKNGAPFCCLLPTVMLSLCISVSLNTHSESSLISNTSSEEESLTNKLSDDTAEHRESTTAAIDHSITKVNKPENVDESLSVYKDGTYTGTGTGFGGPITVKVVIKGGKISDISIVSTSDDSPYIDNASVLLQNIIKAQSTNIDTVSGATYSSVGIIEAVRDALHKAGGDSSSDSSLPRLNSSPGANQNKSIPNVQSISEPDSYTDGTYIGTGTGFGGPITVEVKVQNGKIADISIISTSDDYPYINNASTLLQKIISGQSTNVDTVSGATYSSAGLIEAVRNALSKAHSDNQGLVSTTTTTDINTTVTASGKYPYKDGTYTGIGEGYKSDIKVEVVLKDGIIMSVNILAADDDEPFFTRASNIIESVKEKQSTEIDAVSGATFSSEGILEAIDNAMEQARLSSEDTTTVTTTCTTVPGHTTFPPLETTISTTSTLPNDNLYNDGIYVGTAICYPDDNYDFDDYSLSVTIEIENGIITRITDICIDDTNYDPENDWYKERAAYGTKKNPGIIEQILSLQTVNGEIDAVSGATCSSDAIIMAVQDALNKALK